MSDATEPRLIEIRARWEAICDLLDGKEVSDFMMSFPEVRLIADLLKTTEELVQQLEKAQPMLTKAIAQEALRSGAKIEE